MRLYIDKENILAFMSNRNSNNDLFDESIRLIKKGIEVYYNFPKKDILENQVLALWFRTVKGTGVQNESFYSDNEDIKPLRPLKSNFYVEYNSEDRSSVYLLNIEENICDVIRKKHSILIGRPGDEMELFKSLLDMNDSEQFLSEISWGDYCPKLPLTDIIIFDNHYFKDIDVYNKNDNELIRVLAEIPKDLVNVVIFTKEGEVDRRINLDDECKKIKDMISKVSGLSKGKCSVTIITTYSGHDRNIITNYYRIKVTSCTHLKDSRLKNDVSVELKPNSNSNSNNISKGLINKYEAIAKKPVKVYGDKRSNYISFD